MYINWPHYYIPKFNGLCSFLVNPIFIFIIFADKRLQLGNYRCLLLYFAIFNMICSACDILVPMCVHDHRYAFSVFTSDGFFEKVGKHDKFSFQICFQYSETNQFMLAFRCSFVSATYAILHAHFVYRFMRICNNVTAFSNKFLAKYFLPYGMIASIVYCLFHMVYWIVALAILLFVPTFRQRFKEEISRILLLRNLAKRSNPVAETVSSRVP
ncbi:hypothetical protein CRE_09290 [Caenorhabditis remanei]|uniref:Uncharacterized protein n=1 Tax=Caenorhabditis remanei TaxID=31234 RepID=E3LI08_CAERE|nr:hypothetical protein CRE_09290 [Caenorhabditis remanei]